MTSSLANKQGGIESDQKKCGLMSLYKGLAQQFYCLIFYEFEVKKRHEDPNMSQNSGEKLPGQTITYLKLEAYFFRSDSIKADKEEI